MNEVYEELDDPGLVAWVILIQDAEFNSPKAGYCKQYEASHPMSLRLLFDPTGDTAIYGSKETSIISNEAGTITFEGHSDTPELIRSALIAELADVEGACYSAAQCAQGQYCVPLPYEVEGYEVSVCAELCAIDDPAACPEGKACEQLQPGNPNGACLAPQPADE